MFDGSLPEIADLASLTDAELVDAAGGWARAENAAGARKLAVMAEIFSRRTRLDAGERELWWIDPDAAVAAELAAALNVSTGMALHQTHRGVALRDRLPKVAALFEAGAISDLLVRTIVSRTYLIDDDDAMAAVDAALAERVVRLGCVVGQEDRGRRSTHWSTNTTPARCGAPPSRPPSRDGAVRLTDRCGRHHHDLGAAELRGCRVDGTERRGDRAQRL